MFRERLGTVGWVGLLAVALVLASGARAGDRIRLTPAVEVSQTFDSNIGNDSEDEVSDWVTTVTPTLEISQEGDRGHAALRLGVTSRSHWDNAELNALDRFVQGEFDRSITPRLALFMNGRYDFLPERDTTDEDVEPSLQGQRPDFERHRLSTGFRYALDPLSTLTVTTGLSGEDFDRGDFEGGSFFRRDRRSYFTSLGYSRLLSERDEADLTLSYANSWFQEIDFRAGEEKNDTLSAIASWRHDFSQAWSGTLGGGLRWITIEQDETPGTEGYLAPAGLDRSPTERSVGFIGTAAVERKTPLSDLRLGYTRETRPSSGYGGDVDVDTLSGRFGRRLTERLRVTVDGFLQRYESIGESVLSLPFFENSPELGGLLLLSDNAIDARLWGANVRLDWRVGRYWSTFLRYHFRDQHSEGDREIEDYDDHRAIAGFRYAFPIDLY